MLQGKHIIVGVTGSIAAYKAASLVRLLVKAGAEVKVVMTPTAKQFITPLTLATLSKNPILVDFFNPENGEWNSHVSLGLWADAYVIAPATAATLGKMVSGVADNLLVTTYLSARCPVFVAPAMDFDMFLHPSTSRNLHMLQTWGVTVVEPASGELASGLSGKGRMAEPEEIVAQIDRKLSVDGVLSGRRILINLGGTIERIDPVRYISNDSTGKMGLALAEESLARGADVTVIAGRVSVDLSRLQGARIVQVQSAEQMYEACCEAFESVDAAILTAAVADYTPETVSDVKIKKSTDALTLRLRPTHDIAAELGAVKGTRLVVGFALETDHEDENALAKLRRKNFDFIVLNSLRDRGAAFGYDTNKITLLRPDGSRTESPLQSKHEAAREIIDELQKHFIASDRG